MRQVDRVWTAAWVIGLAGALAVSWLRDARPSGGIVSFDVEEARGAFRALDLSPLTDAGTQATAGAALRRALARYPAAALARRLDRVYVVRRIAYGGTAMGGTNDRWRRIVLTTGRKVLDGVYVGHAVQHELAHLLQDSAGEDFPAKPWFAANAPDFRYGRGGFDAVRRGRTHLAYDPRLAAQGVLSEYGASSFHEDWATIGAAVAEDDPAFWNLVARFPRLREKARLAVAFYRRSFPGIVLRDVAH